MENTYGYDENVATEFDGDTTADTTADHDTDVEQDNGQGANVEQGGDQGTDGNVFDNLEAFKQKMDASVERLEEARVAMHAADDEYDKVRESRNETVSQAEKEANEKIAEVRDREMAVVAEVRREADLELDAADEAADNATIEYKRVFDDVIKSGALTRDMLGALGYSKVTKRRVAAKKNK